MNFKLFCYLKKKLLYFNKFFNKLSNIFIIIYILAKVVYIQVHIMRYIIYIFILQHDEHTEQYVWFGKHFVIRNSPRNASLTEKKNRCHNSQRSYETHSNHVVLDLMLTVEKAICLVRLNAMDVLSETVLIGVRRIADFNG